MTIMKKGVCCNTGKCAKADDQEVIYLSENRPFICPSCGSALTAPDEPTRTDWRKLWAMTKHGTKILLMIIGVLTILAALLIFYIDWDMSQRHVGNRL